MNILKYIISVICSSYKDRLTAVEAFGAIRTVPGVSITVPINKTRRRVVKLAVTQGQIDESSIFFSIYELSYLKRIMRLLSLSYRESR